MEATPDAIRERCARDVAAIEARQLPAEVKQELAARRITQADDEMQHLAQAAIAQIDTRRAELTTSSFRPQNGTLSWRDARAAAAEINEPQAALAALKEADSAGDPDMATAIARRAAQFASTQAGRRDWTPIVDAYASTRPAVQKKLAELAELPDTSRADFRLKVAMHYHVPRPSLLSGMRDDEIRKLARRGTDVA